MRMRTAVHHEVATQAQKLGLHVPTMERIEQVEGHAFGSIDYGSKWALAVVSAMRSI
jgi:hypothetical protein